MTVPEQLDSMRPQSQRKELIQEKDYFEQLEIFYSLFKLKQQREMLDQKLINLKKQIQKNLTEQHTYQFDAIRNVMTEVLGKRDELLSKLSDEFNFFKIRDSIAQYNEYIKELNKKHKKRLIDANTHRITYNYYESQLRDLNKSLKRLKIISIEFILLKKNEIVALETEQRVLKWKRTQNQIEREGYSHKKKCINTEIQKLKEKINFFNTNLTNT